MSYLSHLYELRPAARNGKKAIILESKYMSPSEIEPATPRFPTWRFRLFGNTQNYKL